MTVVKSHALYEFADGSLENVDSTGSGDLKEKSLIVLFGHHSLLNKQHGGFINDYVPSDCEELLFLSLVTNAFQLFDSLVRILNIGATCSVKQITCRYMQTTIQNSLAQA